MRQKDSVRHGLQLLQPAGWSCLPWSTGRDQVAMTGKRREERKWSLASQTTLSRRLLEKRKREKGHLLDRCRTISIPRYYFSLNHFKGKDGKTRVGF